MEIEEISCYQLLCRKSRVLQIVTKNHDSTNFAVLQGLYNTNPASTILVSRTWKTSFGLFVKVFVQELRFLAIAVS